MLKRPIAAIVILFAIISISFAGSVPDMQEGKWEITSKMEVPGMPMEMPPVKNTQCLTKEDFVPQSSQPGQDCKFSQVSVTGNTVKWTMLCNSQGDEMKGVGEMIYRGNSFEGTIKMTSSQGNMEMTNHIKGRHIGDCK
ncbi:MAG: DUF3617 domain-containing protein [Desulfobacterales bacterium]|jgi:hypothetical protein|nr:DUF3617 domain-containing protein [Desulfobacterales bacterium]